MANLHCDTSQPIVHHIYKWKLKRPNNTMEMLNNNGSIYQIMNVGPSDEGSYSCTFDTNSNLGVPGDNSLCLITLGIQPSIFSFSFFISFLSVLSSPSQCRNKYLFCQVK